MVPVPSSQLYDDLCCVNIIDANKKANQLAGEVSDLLSSVKDKGGKQNELSKRIANLKTKITEINKATND